MIQSEEQFVLFAMLDSAMREMDNLGVAPLRNYLTTRRFLEGIDALYGDPSEVVISHGAAGYGAGRRQLHIYRVELWL